MRSVVVVIQHEANDSAAYMEKYLISRMIDFVIFCCWDDGVASLLPQTADEVVHCLPVENKPHQFIPSASVGLEPSGKTEGCRIRGVVSFGGSMSVNDELPYFASIRCLMRSCVAARVPIIGHCLGGQLLSSALGGRVAPSETIEVGWYDIDVEEVAEAKDWFGGRKCLNVFHIHTESFTIPPGAVRIATGPYCANQAFQVGDQFTIGMQFHPEVDGEKVRGLIAPPFPALYTEAERAAVLRNDGDKKVAKGAMTREMIERCLQEGRVESNRPIADSIYDMWYSGFLSS